MKTLALFDFDGTITHKDSMFDFIHYAVGSKMYYFGLFRLVPTFILLLLKQISNEVAKKRVLNYYFSIFDEKSLKEIAYEYSMTSIDKIIRPEAMMKIKWHQAQGHTLSIVSASIECWLQPWCKKHGINLISTKLEIDNGLFTGRFSTKNCYGPEKLNRIEAQYNLKAYDVIYAYGDSMGDKEMMEIATKSFYKPFRD